jgi:hypothetical protein
MRIEFKTTEEMSQRAQVVFATRVHKLRVDESNLIIMSLGRVPLTRVSRFALSWSSTRTGI